MSIERRVEEAAGRMAERLPMVYAVLGIGLCRALIGWALGMTRGPVADLTFIPAQYLVGAGEVATFFLIAIVMRRLVLLRDSNAAYLTLKRDIVPPGLLVLVSILSLSFGIGDSITGMGHSTVYSKMGMGLPELCALLGLLLIPARFDFSLFFKATVVLVALGLGGILFPGELLGFGQTLMSAADESLQLFALILACCVSRSREVSSAGYTALIMGCVTLFIRLGIFVGALLAGNAGLLYGVSLGMVVLAAAFILRLGSVDGQMHLDLEAQPSNELLMDYARSKGLSKREATVFLLLMKGLDYGEIGEELFIAPSTVRAHVSRIFEKCGVHGRAELDQSVKRAVC